jgi:transcription elongation GreA/GreB family factor
VVSGRDRFYKLVARRLDPLDAAQVALDSTLGRAFLGRRVGDEVEMLDGAGTRRLRIVMIKSVPERLRLTAPVE